ncbi:MAG: tetratricopeptide repeat protein [Alphaproteobacteria bacterium]|nr:tetratricopeptide repeat protein [Alphaproteobacteria bacterium]
MRPVLAEILLKRAAAAEAAGDPAGALALLAEHEGYDPGNRDAAMLRGWSLYKLGRTNDAAATFAALYREAPDEKSADGLVTALARERRQGAIARLAADQGGPLAARWAAEASALYRSRNLLLAAEASAPGRDASLAGIAGPAVSAGATFRSRSGASGLSALDTFAYGTSARLARERNRITLGLDVIRLDAGTPAATSLIGSASGPRRVGPTTTLRHGIEPHAAYRWEGWLSPSIRLGATPFGGEVSALPVGRAGLEQQLGAGRAGIEIFAEPRRDSILSYTGIRDPHGGASFGRVVEHGGRLHAMHQLDERWSVAGEIAATWLAGRNVADNERLRAAASLGYDLGVAGFDYLAVGPRYGFETYGRNLGQFTTGHGGYFSPRALHRAGLGAAFQTAEGRTWTVGGTLFAGWQHAREDEAPVLPRADDGRRYAAATNNGFSFDGEMRAVVRLDPNWQLATGLRFLNSPNFDEFGVGLFLTYLPGGRAATFASDFPETLYETAR